MSSDALIHRAVRQIEEAEALLEKVVPHHLSSVDRVVAVAHAKAAVANALIQLDRRNRGF